MIKNSQKKQYYDVEITFADGTSELLSLVRRENFDPGIQSHLSDIVFISKDCSEIRIPRDKTILIMDYFALDGKGRRKSTRPNIEYRNFNYVPKTEKEKELIAKIDKTLQKKINYIPETEE
jgi:hypothetical protein